MLRSKAVKWQRSNGEMLTLSNRLPAGSATHTEYKSVYVNGKRVPFVAPDPEKGPYTPGNPDMYLD